MRIRFYLLIVFMLFISFGLSNSRDSVKERISSEEAAKLIGSSLTFSKNLKKQGFTVKTYLEEITDDELWERMTVQIFIAELYFEKPGEYPVGLEQTMIIKNRKAKEITNLGFQLVNYCISDLDNDKRPELVFCYEGGSGICRTSVGLYTEQLKFIDTEPHFVVDGLFKLNKLNDQQVELRKGGLIGRLLLLKVMGGYRLSVKLNEKVLPSIRKCIHFYE